MFSLDDFEGKFTELWMEFIISLSPLLLDDILNIAVFCLHLAVAYFSSALLWLGSFLLALILMSLSTEALGNNAGPSTSPPVGERKLFSDVTRLGFASAQDSPPLRLGTGDANGQSENSRDQGTRYPLFRSLDTYQCIRTWFQWSPDGNNIFLLCRAVSDTRIIICQHHIFQ